MKVTGGLDNVNFLLMAMLVRINKFYSFFGPTIAQQVKVGREGAIDSAMVCQLKED
jgi:hypothetical protein